MGFSAQDKKESPWLEDRIWVKVYNVRYPKENIYVAVNGHSFSIQPGVAVRVPRAVVGALRDAIEIHYAQKVVGPDEVPEQIPFTRFEVVEVAAPADENISQETTPTPGKTVIQAAKKNKENNDFIASVVEDTNAVT